MDNLNQNLIKLQKTRSESQENYNRVNPFVEDITDWKEKRGVPLRENKI